MASGELEKILFIPDAHVPRHDPRAFEVMLAAARSFKPDTIVILGDFADFESVSSHDKNPSKLQDLSSEVNDVIKALRELDKLGATQKFYCAGNHEDRLARYIAQRAAALFGCLSVPELFRLPHTGWTYVPYKQALKLGKLRCTHDTGAAGVNAHRQSSSVFRGSVVIGHTHRLAYEVLGVQDGHPHLAAMLGWLGDVDQIDYLHKAKAAQWSLGFGVGYKTKTGVVHLTPVPIIDYSCVVNGKLFTA